MGLDYLRDPHSPIRKEYHLIEAKRRVFSAVAPTFWNIIPPEVRLAPTLLAFQKDLKTWLCHRLWGGLLK